MISITVSAQFDTGKKSVVIPAPQNLPDAPKTTTSPSKPFELPPGIKDPDAPTPDRSLLSNDNPFSLQKKNEFVSPGKVYEDKLNQRGDGQQYKMFRQNIHLGDIRTTSSVVTVNYRDFGNVIDGDLIRIWVNDKVVKELVYLEGSFKGLEIKLQKGFNKVDFEAIQEGYSLPNTAEFRIDDDKGVLLASNQWALAKGFKATIVIVRE